MSWRTETLFAAPHHLFESPRSYLRNLGMWHVAGTAGGEMLKRSCLRYRVKKTFSKTMRDVWWSAKVAFILIALADSGTVICHSWAKSGSDFQAWVYVIVPFCDLRRFSLGEVTQWSAFSSGKGHGWAKGPVDDPALNKRRVSSQVMQSTSFYRWERRSTG